MTFLSSENIIFHILIAIPTFFILRWLLKKFIKNNRYRIAAVWVFTIILTPFLYLLAIVIFFTILFHEPTKDFNKTSWSIDSNHRFQMADNIINSKILIGKDTTQVKLILGNPTTNYESIHQWNYNMGEGGGGLGFMFHFLIVKFEKGKVVSIDHATFRD